MSFDDIIGYDDLVGATIPGCGMVVSATRDTTITKPKKPLQGNPIAFPLLRWGDYGMPALTHWQDFLGIEELHKPGTQRYFGDRTEAATKEFQKNCGLIKDGIVGPLTWRAATIFKNELRKEQSKPAAQIQCPATTLPLLVERIRSGNAPHSGTCVCVLCTIPRNTGWGEFELERRIAGMGADLHTSLQRFGVFVTGGRTISDDGDSY